MQLLGAVVVSFVLIDPVEPSTPGTLLRASPTPTRISCATIARARRRSRTRCAGAGGSSRSCRREPRPPSAGAAARCRACTRADSCPTAVLRIAGGGYCGYWPGWRVLRVPYCPGTVCPGGVLVGYCPGGAYCGGLRTPDPVCTAALVRSGVRHVGPVVLRRRVLLSMRRPVFASPVIGCSARGGSEPHPCWRTRAIWAA